MKGRGRSVLSFVFACALIGALAPAAGAHQRRHAAQQRLRPRLEVRAGQPHRHHRPHRRLRQRRRPGLRRRPVAHASTSRTTGASSSTRRPRARPATPATSRAASAGTARRSRCRARPRARAISLEFDGVYMDSVRLPQRQAGRQATRTATPASRSTSRTRTPTATRRTSLAVEVHNKLPSSRWYSGSGIYRNVHLVVTDPVHVARHGTFVTTPDVESTFKQGFANVHVAHRRRRRHGSRHDRVVTSVQDARGRTVAARRARRRRRRRQRHRRDLRLAPSAPVVDRRPVPLHARRPRSARAGSTVDRTTTTFGIRWFHFDPAQGFSLNGHADEAPRRRPAPRRGRARLGGQQGRAHAPDDAS